MAYTINFDSDFVGAEELQLLQTKQAILEKLRVRFGDMAQTPASAPKTWAANGWPNIRTDHPH